MTLKNWKKASVLGQKPQPLVPSMDEIPEALRDIPNPVQRDWLKAILLLTGGLGLGAIAVFSTVLLIAHVSPQTLSSTAPDPDENANPDSSPATSVDPREPQAIANSPASSPASPSDPAAPPVDNVLGHLPYQVVPETELQAISPNGQIRLHRSAAQKFNEMAAAARSSGVILMPISGFRTVEEQNYLFFEVKAQRNQVASQRAEVSAPPGYSEHHTGYAVDIGDGNVPSTNLQVAFENTAAFKWLEQNAARYGFEISFPPNNPQGVSYEPWHWRFVGDIKSLETFYRAHNLPEQ